MAKVRAKVKTKAKDAVSPRVARMLRIGCLAGWVTALSLSKKKAEAVVDPISFAAQKLGFSDEQRSGLFGSTADWPLKFSQAYHRAKTPLQIAKVAAKRVEWFIKTGE